jgi:hypothetical protein
MYIVVPAEEGSSAFARAGEEAGDCATATAKYSSGMNLRVLKQRFATAANDARNAHTAHIAAAAVVVACWRRRSSKRALHC